MKALKLCLVEIMKKVNRLDVGRSATPISIPLAATTGSSREILGVFLETQGVYNEIIAHSVGTTHFSKDVDTIFEIGGQDAKYVLLKNGVPIDYAMNEACSAGTGSFLEESAQGDLNIGSAAEIGPIALSAKAPLKFGEHCSAFINSDIRKAVQQGATREDITAGIVCSIVANYLNRVVGNRTHRAEGLPPGRRRQEQGRAPGLRDAPRQAHPRAALARAHGLLRRRPARQAEARRRPPAQGLLRPRGDGARGRSSTRASSSARPARTSAPSRC